MDIQEILAYLPHRYPFLLIDRILEVIPDKSVRALKNVTMNEPFFTGHFPERPIMPGVIILEAMAQASGILAFTSQEHKTSGQTKSLFLFAGADNVRFKRVVIPGDQLIIESELLKVRNDIWKCRATALVDGQLACSAELLAAKKGDML